MAARNKTSIYCNQCVEGHRIWCCQFNELRFADMDNNRYMRSEECVVAEIMRLFIQEDEDE